MVLGQAYCISYPIVDFMLTSVPIKFYIRVSLWGSMVLKAAEKPEPGLRGGLEKAVVSWPWNWG